MRGVPSVVLAFGLMVILAPGAAAAIIAGGVSIDVNGKGACSSIKVDGKEIAAGTTASGFYVTDVQAGKMVPASDAASLGLGFETQYLVRDGYILVEGNVRSLRAEQERAVDVTWFIAFSGDDWDLWRDLNSRASAGLAFGMAKGKDALGSFVGSDLYTFNAATSPRTGRGLALAVPPTDPCVFVQP